jgi:2-succinyl-5-enolpyruvyl-6-hydroxy-3-cyclohexene-1-carboxylate synthase
MALRNALTEASRLIVSTLADAGVVDLVVSPGSRSTPLVVAAVREPRLRCHSVVDERAAAFFALGKARVEERPSALVCTSGTALVHYLPALVEACLTGVPMLVLSADRPHDVQHAHAPQTIDQVKIFGDYVRAFYDLPAPDGSTSLMIGLRRMVGQAVATSIDPRPGPVHVNVRARKPLEPTQGESSEEKALTAKVSELARRTLPVPGRTTRTASASSVDAARAELAHAKRGILVCGPALPSRVDLGASVFELARRTGFPVYAEATSQLRYGTWPDDVRTVAHLDLVVRTLAREELPDLVVQIGLPSTYEVLAKLDGSVAPPSVVVLAEDDACDPSGLASAFLFGDIGDSCRRLAEGLSPLARDPFEVAERKSRAAVDAEIASGAFAEGHAVRVLVESCRQGDALVVGNSLAVRALDTYTRPGGPRVVVVSQRGASGIDGNVALAAGVADATGAPTTLLCGDVTLMHDLGTFVQARSLVKNLRIVLLNNGGGRIFEQLPIVGVPDLDSRVLDLTLTPHNTDFSGVALSAGARHVRVSDEASLRAALSAPVKGLELVEVVLSSSGAIAQNRRVWKAL